MNLKRRATRPLAAIGLVALTTLAPAVASAHNGAAPQHGHGPRYRLIDLGTFGGPNSADTVEFPLINNRHMVVGFADTATPDNSPEGFVYHAFRWRGGPIEDLGTLPGGTNSFAVWSNDAGLIVGLSDTGQFDAALGAPAADAVMWKRNGQIVDLGTLGGTQSLAVHLNERGQIVGVAANNEADPFSMFGWSTQTRAVLWDHGRIRDLGTLGGPDATANFVNERGQIAGVSYTDSTPNEATGIPTQHPFLWNKGTMIDLGTLGGVWSSVMAFNDHGQVVGASNLAGDTTQHPYLWDRSRLLDLGTLGGSSGTAWWLNNAGTVVGGSWTAADAEFHAFSWRQGVMRDLGTVGDDTCSLAKFENEHDQVVGTSGECGGEFEKHAFISEDGQPMIDLNTLVAPGSGITITDGESINDRGEIAGSGVLPNGDHHAIVLIPIR